MDPNITSAVRDIFLIVAAAAFATLCATIVVLVLKLYRPLRDAVQNGARTAENLNRVSTDVAHVSGETTNNILQSSRNAVTISENLKDGSKDLSDTIQTAKEAANNVAAAAGTVGTIAENVSRFSSLGVSGGGGSSGVGTLLRLLRGVFGGGRRGEDGAD